MTRNFCFEISLVHSSIPRHIPNQTITANQLRALKTNENKELLKSVSRARKTKMRGGQGNMAMKLFKPTLENLLN